MLDVYINDTIGLTVDLPDTDITDRMECAPLLAIHTAARPANHHEPIPRDEIAAKAKLSTEGALEEQKIILGWYFDLRKLTIALPENKLIAWTKLINSMLLIGKTTLNELEQLIGRLSHLGVAVPFVHHFLSRLQDLHHSSKNWRGVPLLDKCKKDLKLMLHFLEIGEKEST
jgi:hypothetical protein